MGRPRRLALLTPEVAFMQPILEELCSTSSFAGDGLQVLDAVGRRFAEVFTSRDLEENEYSVLRWQEAAVREVLAMRAEGLLKSPGEVLSGVWMLTKDGITAMYCGT